VTRAPLIGRQAERAQLEAALAGAMDGRGSIVLVSGEAGSGKTRLATDATRSESAAFVRGAATPASSPFGPITAALRVHLRREPAALGDCGPLRSHLALLLPELGEARATEDRATLFEAIRCGLVAMVSERPAAVLLDDMGWSDEATLEFLGSLAPSLAQMPLLVIAAYRSDELPRAHPLRRLRHDLRREGLLTEVELGPLTASETGELVAQVLGQEPSPRLVQVLHDRTGGVPFFVREFAAALVADDRLEEGPDGASLALEEDVPLPRTVREAVLVQTSGLSPVARAAGEAAAVAGADLDLELLASLGDEQGVGEVLASGLLVESEPGHATFRHPLAREAIYDDIPWLRRRSLHAALARELRERGGEPAEIAGHWLAARDSLRALEALLEAIPVRGSLHAYRDATRLGRQALDLWPAGERGGERVAMLEEHARYAQLAGELGEAARAQREVVAARRAEGAGRALADAERRISGIYALQGKRDLALAARRVSAEAFAANGLPGEAAVDRLTAGAYLQSAGRHTEAAETARTARDEAIQAERPDLRARAMGLEGVARVKQGAFADGIEIIRGGLSLALDRGLTLEAAEVYQRLGTAHEVAGDYARARESLGTAITLCERAPDGGLEHTCLSCMAYVLRELGDWNQAEELCAGLLTPGADAGDTLVADGVLGAIHAWRGRPEQARPLLTRCLETTTRLDVVSMQCDSAAALAWLAAAEGDEARVHELCRLVLERWTRSEDHHYGVWGLRWAAAWFARHDAASEARACAEALSAIAGSAGYPDALAALAHALAEAALAEGDPAGAAEQMTRALELHAGLDIPFERAQIALRAGVALAAAGERDMALGHLADAHRAAQQLGAAPLADEIAAEVVAQGASLQELLGTRAAAAHEHAGLSRRELEVVRLLADGLTNREIAERLVLSTRTIDMHVRNILTKLRCRSRTEAAGRAVELGLLDNLHTSVSRLL
jgi:DNA-binding CsgD family transcriptional regulator/tetratricopeptide (TPR) repeat protein